MQIGYGHDIEAEGALYAHGAADANGNGVAFADVIADGSSIIGIGFFIALFIRFECEYLTECAHIQPLLAGYTRIVVLAQESLAVLFTFDFFLLAHCAQTCLERRAAVRTVAQGTESVHAAVVRLYEYWVTFIHPAVADLALQANVRNLAVAVICGARAVAAQRIAVGIGVPDGEYKCKIDFVV